MIIEIAPGRRPRRCSSVRPYREPEPIREKSVKIHANYKGKQVQDSYDIIRTIGEGGQGKTELVRRVADRKTLIRKEQKRFKMHESKALPLESYIFEHVLEPHPGIVLFDHSSYVRPCASDRSGSLVLYFEHCEGGDLDSYIDTKVLVPEKWIWKVFVQLAEALAYMHYGLSQLHPNRDPPKAWPRVIHRDIKPANVFLQQRVTKSNPYPDVVLGDFGLATIRKYSNLPCGTETWIPPEFPIWSAKGDVWALGTTIYALAQGRPMGSSRTRSSLPSFYGRDLSDDIAQCLRTDPRDRVASLDLVDMVKRHQRRFLQPWEGGLETCYQEMSYVAMIEGFIGVISLSVFLLIVISEMQPYRCNSLCSSIY